MKTSPTREFTAISIDHITEILDLLKENDSQLGECGYSECGKSLPSGIEIYFE